MSPVAGVFCDENVVSFENCIKCASTLENKCPFTLEVVQSIIDGRDQEDKLNLRASNILDCPRSVYLQATTTYNIKLEDYYYAFRGTLIHKLLETSKKVRGAIVEKRFFKKCGDFTISGKPDFILPKKKFLRDWKTTKELPRYNSAYSSHTNQFNVYRWLLAPEIEIDNGEIVYLSMEGMKRIPIPKSKMISLEEIERGINHSASILTEAFKNNTPPPVPEDFPKYWKCDRFCDVSTACFNEFKKGK